MGCPRYPSQFQINIRVYLSERTADSRTPDMSPEFLRFSALRRTWLAVKNCPPFREAVVIRTRLAQPIRVPEGRRDSDPGRPPRKAPCRGRNLSSEGREL
jgi:hypothetical protein